MVKSSDNMAPNASPSVLNKTGVRRVNNYPLYVVLFFLMLFVVVIALVAAKRGEKSQLLLTDAPHVMQSVDSSKMAEEVLSGHASGIIPSSKPDVIEQTTQMVMPIAVLDNPDAPPVPGRIDEDDELIHTEMTRIRLEKIQEFERAVKAKTRIELPSQISSRTSDAHDKQAMLDKISVVQKRLEQVGDPNASFQQKLQGMRSRIAGNGGAGGNQGMTLLSPSDASDSTSDRWSLGHNVEAPLTPYVLRAGSVIPGTMISGITSELPGQIIGQVSQDVYDTATGKYLLFPQGTRLFGLYSNEVAYGQSSILVAWQRMTFPDGKVLDIGSMPGADSAGNAGFRDQVDNHTLRIFGQAILMSGVVAGVTYSQLQNQSQSVPFGPPNAGSVMSAAMGQQLGEVTAQMIAKNLNIAPLAKIRAGYKFNVMVTKDMVFSKPYQSFDY